MTKLYPDVLSVIYDFCDFETLVVLAPERARERYVPCYKNWERYSRDGRLEVLQWMHQRNLGRCATTAMDVAAENGHFHIVQWLHENRTEGCTSRAILTNKEWFYKNRFDDYTRALKTGHPELIEYYEEQRLMKATYNSRMNIISWLEKLF